MLSMFTVRGYLPLVVALFGWGQEAGEPKLTRFQYTELHMGVQARIVVYAPSAERAEAACRSAFQAIADLDQAMSDYRPASELMRLCAQAGGPPVRVSEDLFELLRRAQLLAERTDGAFDVTIGPLVRLWRSARKSGVLPGTEELEKARALVGYRKMRLDSASRTVLLESSGMLLDLGGIAKGYACDRALEVLRKAGLARAMIEFGGDIVVGEPPPGTDGWAVELFEPSRSKNRTVRLRNSAISSSGDVEQFVEIGGVRYSHIVDPKSGLGLRNQVAVTVIARNGTDSDSLATALSVLGPGDHRTLLRAYPGASAYIRR